MESGASLYRHFSFSFCLTLDVVFFTAGCLARKLYAAKRETAAAISIQKYVRMWLLNHAYTKLSLAAVVIQSNIRGFSTRHNFMHGKKHKAATLIQVSSILWSSCLIYVRISSFWGSFLENDCSMITCPKHFIFIFVKKVLFVKSIYWFSLVMMDDDGCTQDLR